ncbi:MAG: hypothetical protein JKY65_02255 [Planctomycetes bacterium]|nr:hypothetical protein [Planctomycetota bacterium]
MIVCLEGINGSGKTTLGNGLLAIWAGGSACTIDPTQHTPFGRALRTAIMAETSLGADVETLAFASARLRTAEVLTSPAPEARDLVVLERWAGAVMAYGTVAGASPVLLEAVEQRLLSALPIDITVLLDLPGGDAEARVNQLAERNRFETQGSGYLERIRRQYLAWASNRQVSVVDGRQEVATIVELVAELMKAKAPHISADP